MSDVPLFGKCAKDEIIFRQVSSKSLFRKDGTGFKEGSWIIFYDSVPERVVFSTSCDHNNFSAQNSINGYNDSLKPNSKLSIGCVCIPVEKLADAGIDAEHTPKNSSPPIPPTFDSNHVDCSPNATQSAKDCFRKLLQSVNPLLNFFASD